MSADSIAKRAPLRWAAASVALLALVTSFAPQGLHFFDPVVQSLALQQYEAGVSPSWNVLMRVDPHDLARDIPEFITWWPPSTQLLALPLHAVGLSPALALRVVALLAIGAGLLGWTHWFARFALPRSWLIGLVVALPWLRAVSGFLFRYSADALAFAAMPWILLLHVRLLQRLRDGQRSNLGFAALTGAVTGLSFGLKYSLGVTALAALGAVWLWLIVTSRTATVRHAAFPPLSLASGLALLVPIAWRVATWRFGGATPLGHAPGEGFDPMGFVYFVANPALALADLFGPLFFVFVFPGVAPLATGTMTTLAWIGLPGGLLLAWLLRRAWHDGADRDGAWIGGVTLAGASLALLALWLGADVSHEPRLIAPAALGVLPIALAEGRRLWSESGTALRATLAAAAGIFVAFPVAFGPCYVAAKTRAAFSIRPGPTGLNLPNLRALDFAAARREFASHHHAKAVWVAADPEIALELPGRALLLASGGSIGADLRNFYAGRTTLGDWRTSEDRELLVLWPASDEATPPRPLAAARNITGWQRTQLKHCGLTLWRGWLRAPKP